MGDDLIGGGAGSDNIKGGDGNDFIVGAESLSVLQRSKPTDSWTLPAGATLLSQGNTWGTYTQDGTVFWYRPNPVVVDDAPDVIDAGAGDDWVFGGRGGRSNTKTAHARSMRLAGHKGLGRRMDAGQGA